jgi:hypothetical protein
MPRALHATCGLPTAGSLRRVCFLLLHHRTREDAPIVLLANRDERYDRAFEAPTWRGAGGAVLAPRDLEAGGTWLGVTRRGVLAAITNRRESAHPLGTRSRGLLVDEALAHADARSALAWARGHLVREAYAGFNLLLADADDAFVLRHPGAPRPRVPEEEDVRRLSPGAHALTNLHDLDEVPIPPAGRPRAEEPLAETLRRLEGLAADDQTPLPREHRIFRRPAVERDAGGRGPSPGRAGRGTVCAAVLAVRRDGTPLFRFAAGPPDRTPFVLVT